MIKRASVSVCVIAAAALSLGAQDIKLSITGGTLPVLAAPELAGAGAAVPYMAAFNRTLWDDLEGAGMFHVAPRTMYPTAIPQQPRDFSQAAGRRLSDWAAPPVSADYLAFGYTAVQNGVFVLYGWMFDARLDLATGQVIGNRYFAMPGEAGAKKLAHEFAADIIAKFGGQPLYNTHIYFTSDRTGHKEIWAMDEDGSNQRQITRFKFIAQFAAVSPDGSRLAFTAWPGPGQSPRVYVYSTDPVLDLGFQGRETAASGTPSFTPDGRRIVYMGRAGEAYRIYESDLNGADFQELTLSDFVDAEPKVNPKTGGQIVFSSGRSGKEQIYRANMDGLDVQLLTNGTGTAANPAWNPNGQTIAFAWTQGYQPGHFNIFTMDVASGTYTQLTHDEGKNENPSWSPGGTHIVFGSNRGGTYQIWTMLADGTQAKQLTTVGNNSNPVWGK